MNLLKKISLVYTLQVSAVVIIFAYPGCSSTTVQDQNKTAVESSLNEIPAGAGKTSHTKGRLPQSPADIIQTQMEPAFFSFKTGK